MEGATHFFKSSPIDLKQPTQTRRPISAPFPNPFRFLLLYFTLILPSFFSPSYLMLAIYKCKNDLNADFVATGTVL
jgi:hypothetical protein